MRNQCLYFRGGVKADGQGSMYSPIPCTPVGASDTVCAPTGGGLVTLCTFAAWFIPAAGVPYPVVQRPV